MIILTCWLYPTLVWTVVLELSEPGENQEVSKNLLKQPPPRNPPKWVGVKMNDLIGTHAMYFDN